MWLNIFLLLIFILILFLIYVSTREGKFHYKVKGIIDAPVDKVFLYLSDLKLGNEWSPFARIDPNMKNEFFGETNQPGAKLIFSGNKEAGSGIIEIIKIEQKKYVELKLTMTAPFKGENKVEYFLEEVEGKTEFTWAMSGDGGFMGKLVSIFINCEKMITDQFKEGIENLKILFK